MKKQARRRGRPRNRFQKDTVTFSIRRSILRELSRFCKKDNVYKSHVIECALEDYFAAKSTEKMYRALAKSQ